MDGRFQDERFQFFLRHRDDIREWAAIEPQITAAISAMLEDTQAQIEERLAALSADIVVGRHDAGTFSRIMARRPKWADWLGVSLEWVPARVDPFGSELPKIGFFWWGAADLTAGKATFIEQCIAAGLQAAGWKVPSGNAWPVLRRTEASRTWWQDPDAWVAGVVDQMADLWTRVAPIADATFEALGSSMDLTTTQSA